MIVHCTPVWSKQSIMKSIAKPDYGAGEHEARKHIFVG